MASQTHKCRSGTLSVVLTVSMIVTMVMGVGPGLWLINPDKPGESAFGLWGLPKVYLWGLLWYAVQVVLVGVACFTVWRTDPDDDETGIPIGADSILSSNHACDN